MSARVNGAGDQLVGLRINLKNVAAVPGEAGVAGGV